MPFSYRIYPHERLVVMAGEGRLTGKEIVDELKRYFRDPRLGPGFRVLGDYRRVNGIAIGLDEIKTIARTDKAFSALAYSRLALVAVSPNVITLAHLYRGMQRMVGGGREIRVFDNLDEALAWLGVEEVPDG